MVEGEKGIGAWGIEASWDSLALVFDVAWERVECGDELGGWFSRHEDDVIRAIEVGFATTPPD